MLLLYSLTVVLLFVENVISKNISYGVNADYFVNCEGHNPPNTAANQTLVRLPKGGFSYSGAMIVTEVTDRMTSLVRVLKCTTRADENCELVLKMEHKDFCKEITKKGQLWTKFQEDYQPRFTCPMKTGTYVTTNSSTEVDALVEYAPFPLEMIENSYWKFKIQVFSHPEKKELLCLDSGGQLVVFRKY